MAKGRDFDVQLSDYSVTVDEWFQAQKARKSDLPALTQVQRMTARKMGIREEEYQRSVLASQLGELRLESRGEALGKLIAELLPAIGAGLKLESVKGDIETGRWICRIGAGRQRVSVGIPREAADDALDSGTGVEPLKRLLTSALSRQGLIGKQ